MHSEPGIREQIVEIGRRLYANKFIAARDGNISARLGEFLYFTPTGMCKGFLKTEDIVKTDLGGKKDVYAVVHAHPPHATGYAVAGMALDKALLPEVILTMGRIPLAEYSTPTTEEVARAIRDLVPYHDALLLSNHGAVAYGEDLESAYFKMETLEHFALISIVAKILGRERVLSEDAVKRLYATQGRSEYQGGTSETRTLRTSGCPIPAEALESPSEETLTLTKSELFQVIDEIVSRVRRQS
ncbi:MAG: class II aldolase family protein [Acidobacteria bacterium]|nr:MAG: class II aldolase family protein [Acidobacteriota bacterium]